MIELTPKAQEYMLKYLKEDPKYKYVRLGVLGGGCSGFSYSMGLVEEYEPEWTTIEYPNVTVVVDPMSMMYLEGVTVDYVDSLAGTGFKFINPAVKNTCGCGQSFSV